MKRLIGIDISERCLRVAVLAKEQGRLKVVALEESRTPGLDAQVQKLDDLLGESFSLGDRMAASLPASYVFIRELEFPFQDRKKVAAALNYELAGQLPVQIDHYTTFMQTPQNTGDGVSVVAGAIKTDTLNEFLEPFNRSGLPLHSLDVEPFGSVAGLRKSLQNCLLISVRDDETVLAPVHNGQACGHRVLPNTKSARSDVIVREMLALQRDHGSGESPVYLYGSQATTDLLEQLAKHCSSIELLSLSIEGDRIPTEFVPAVALALRADESGDYSFNLRQGEHALKGEFGGLRKTMFLAASLAAMTIAVLGVAVGLEYSGKHDRLDNIKREMARIYLDTIDDAGQAVDVPLQFQSALQQLKKDSGLSAMDKPLAIALLQTLSELPPETELDLEEMNYELGQVRLSGYVETFDAINSIAQTYRSSGQFRHVEITESKAGLSGGRVFFRLALELLHQEGR